MKIAVINSMNYGSTGNVIWGIKGQMDLYGHDTFVFCPAGRTQKKGLDTIFIGTIVERRLSDFINYFTGQQGGLNILATFNLIFKLKKMKPDIVHLHNLHSNYLNLGILFKYLKVSKVAVVWTFHDCWPFTGGCPYFSQSRCEKWRVQCEHCEAYKDYPGTLFDFSRKNYIWKKKLFTGINNLTIVTPSEWLFKLVKKSFFKNSNTVLINNGIDLSVFQPRKNNIKEQLNIEDKFLILCVSFSWGIRKGLDRIEKLADNLSDSFKIVVIGTNGNEFCNNARERITFLERTFDQVLLSQYYTAADVFFNPTREDNFPTVNLEALACGTPVLSYGAGGSAEVIDNTCGMVVDDASIVSVLESLRRNNFSREACRNKAENYDKVDKYKEYASLYKIVHNA